MSENFNALRRFRERWFDSADFEVSELGRATFYAKIIYESPKRNETDRTEVIILYHGFENGQIDIQETEDLTVDDYHLRLVEKFMKYEFDQNSGSLCLSGNSPDKLGGDYQITIEPKPRP